MVRKSKVFTGAVLFMISNMVYSYLDFTNILDKVGKKGKNN